MHDLSQIRYQGEESHVNDRVAILVSKWNPDITGAMFEGARKTLEAQGLRPENILRLDVPGSFELPAAASITLERHPKLDGLICLGCLIQGETRHFEFISQAVANGLVQVSIAYNKPVIFGVLTTDNVQQARARAGGAMGNKGEEAAVALLEMIDLSHA